MSYKFFSPDANDPVAKLLDKISKLAGTVERVSGNNETPANQQAKQVVQTLKEEITATIQPENISDVNQSNAPTAS